MAVTLVRERMKMWSYFTTLWSRKGTLKMTLSWCGQPVVRVVLLFVHSSMRSVNFISCISQCYYLFTDRQERNKFTDNLKFREEISFHSDPDSLRPFCLYNKSKYNKLKAFDNTKLFGKKGIRIIRNYKDSCQLLVMLR